jgi:hypothetical protein
MEAYAGLPAAPDGGAFARDVLAAGGQREAAEPSRGPHEEQLPMSVERLNFYRAEIKHELNLLSGRVSAYITSQSFLVTAFALSIGGTKRPSTPFLELAFPVTLAALGIIAALQARPGIMDACEVVRRWLEKERELHAQEPQLESYRIERPVAVNRRGQSMDVMHERSLAIAMWSPRTFLIAWPVFASIAVALAFSR